MKVIVFDTETMGRISQTLLNVGYKIIDIDTETGCVKTLLNKDYLNSTLYKNKFAMENDLFVGTGKKSMYDTLVKNKGINSKYGLKKILELMTKDVQKYNVEFAYAYNSNFDIDKISRACEQYGLPYVFNDIKVFDLWAYARKHICDTTEYLTYAKDNSLLTDKGFISTSVESVCKFLYDNLDFVEDHTALSDTQHETYILSECIKRGCDITKSVKYKRFFKVEKTETEEDTTSSSEDSGQAQTNDVSMEMFRFSGAEDPLE